MDEKEFETQESKEELTNGFEKGEDIECHTQD